MNSILNLEPKDYSNEAQKIISEIGHISKGPLKRSDLIKKISNYDALIVRLSHKIDEEIISCSKNLKIISTATTGLNHIDIDFAHKKGIEIHSLKNEIEFLNEIHATAEHTWALIISLIRNIPIAARSVLNGDWDRDEFKGQELNGKTLGIVGLGRIGKKIAKYGICFGMKVIAYTKNPKENYENIQILESLDSLLNKSDIISVHVPLDSTTYKMFSRDKFSKMKKNAFFINTSRGEVVDEDALINSIKENRLMGAALDVIQNEIVYMDKKISKVVDYAKNDKRLLITPHIGGATFESMEKTEIFMAKKLANFFRKNK